MCSGSFLYHPATGGVCSEMAAGQHAVCGENHSTAKRPSGDRNVTRSYDQPESLAIYRPGKYTSLQIKMLHLN